MALLFLISFFKDFIYLRERERERVHACEREQEERRGQGTGSQADCAVCGAWSLSGAPVPDLEIMT